LHIRFPIKKILQREGSDGQDSVEGTRRNPSSHQIRQISEEVTAISEPSSKGWWTTGSIVGFSLAIIFGRRDTGVKP
jgi:hypothetical protein